MRTSLTSPPGAPGRTAWDSVPAKDGFCQVVNRPLNPASATAARPSVARWIGASPSHPRTSADEAGPVAGELPPEPAPEPADAPEPDPAPASDPADAPAPPSRRPVDPDAPRKRSKNPT
ncbi:hypothetical protein [Streptomyces brasiliscabiei]|uniref:hypothetical protein n=1 Tax=Streptomyces brasiliscabiei TaxID=2736302 RepID=UPI001C11DCA3|nr:hypothetical protein [Streptomyces brasiliscabiei]